MLDIIYKEKYVDEKLLGEIKYFVESVNDSFCGGPIEDTGQLSTTLQMEGCSDRPLRLEWKSNPVHKLIAKLKEDLGDFHIHECSIRYMYFPYGPHTDIRSNEVMLESRKKYKFGYTFLIPLSWKPGYVPGTAFFDCPPKEGQQLLVERQDVIPMLQNVRASRNYGIKQMITWKNPGDLVGWMNYQWHSSMIGGEWTYNNKEWCKEFISIETYRFKDD